MTNIFTNNTERDCFCYDIIESWIEYRKSKNLSYDEDSYLDWLEEFTQAMEYAYEDCCVEE